MTGNPVATDTISIDDRTLVFKVDRPVAASFVLSHMPGADMTMWDDVVSQLVGTFRIIRYSGRGHGGSGLDPAPLSIETSGRDVLAILDHLGIEPAIGGRAISRVRLGPTPPEPPAS